MIISESYQLIETFPRLVVCQPIQTNVLIASVGDTISNLIETDAVMEST